MSKIVSILKSNQVLQQDMIGHKVSKLHYQCTAYLLSILCSNILKIKSTDSSYNKILNDHTSQGRNPQSMGGQGP